MTNGGIVSEGGNPTRTADRRLSRWDAHKSERRQRIIECAVAEIRDNGSEVTVTQIAVRAGLTRAAVYRMFDSPDHLYDEIRRTIADELLTRLGTAFGGTTSLTQAIARVVNQYLELATAEPAWYRFVGSTSSKTALNSMRKVTAVHMETEINSYCAHHGLVPSPHIEQLSYALAVLVDSTVAQWARADSANRDERVALESRLVKWSTALIGSEIDVLGTEERAGESDTR